MREKQELEVQITQLRADLSNLRDSCNQEQNRLNVLLTASQAANDRCDEDNQTL